MPWIISCAREKHPLQPSCAFGQNFLYYVRMNEILDVKTASFTADKLQIGVSRLEFLDKRALRYFLNKSWIHLGDEQRHESKWKRIKNKLEVYGIRQCAKDGVSVLWKRLQGRSARNDGAEDLYAQTNFLPFYYKKGDRLSFDNETFNFIFSEHVFEHFFMDEVVALLKEAYRIAKPKGVVRIVVPDADFRPHPEPLPPPNLSLTHPMRHKIRWNVHSLSAILECAGFEAVPLRYYDREKNFRDVNWEQIKEKYQSSEKDSLLFHFNYIQRQDSLIVDGFKAL